MGKIMVEPTRKWIGYARVSTLEQDPEMQVRALRDFIAAKGGDPENVFVETASGKTMDRPVLKTLLRTRPPGTTIVVWKFDRLGRTTRGVLETVEVMEKRGVDFVSVTEPIDTTTPMGKVFFTIMAAFAQMERELISERTKEGMAKKRAAGWKPGPRGMFQTNEKYHARLKELMESGEFDRMSNEQVWEALVAADPMAKKKPKVRTYISWKHQGFPGAGVEIAEPSVDPDSE